MFRTVLRLPAFLILIAGLGLQSPTLAARQSAAAPAATRTRQLFDFDWRFKAGDVTGADAAAFDDAAWEKVDLPHDFMIEGKGQNIPPPARAGGAGAGGGGGRATNLPTEPEGPFDPRSPGGNSNGYLNGGFGWYRKTFTLPETSRNRRTFIEFEGVYMNSEVWINGHSMGVRPYGYSTFEYDVTPYVRFGKDTNVVAVRVNVVQPSTRWYSGAGIYRHVWLTETAQTHIAHWGTTVTTPTITDARASVEIQTTLRNDGTAGGNGTVETAILDRDGRSVGQASAPTAIGAAGNRSLLWTVPTTVAIDHPHRWSIDDPYLYTVVTRLRANNAVIDESRTSFGIRTVEFVEGKGLILNGVHVPMQGVCLHHDQGALGAAAFDRSIERQLQIMKTMGVNAIRTSHNPPAPALLDFADRMGFVVMDEAFDEWKQNKTRFGYGQFFDEWSERDIRDYIRRDRNHPSVIMWSIGNEIPEQGNVQVAEAMATRLAGFVHEEDPTRPITSAMNNPTRALDNGFAKPLQLFGVNYNLGVYERVKDFKSYASETSSNYSSRDEYNLVLKDGVPTIQNQLNNHCTSYDLDFPRWGNTAEVQFQAFRKSPWMGGEFVWTGLDYIGEPTPFSWPNRSSSFGIADLAGFPKDRFYLYQSQWKTQPIVHLLPHWNWPDEYKGKNIPVWAYTNADSVELFLNGKSLGSRSWNGVNELHLTWQVPYEPGTLRAVATKAGKVVAEDRVETTTAATRIELVPDRAAIRADGQDLSFVTVRLLDARGRLVRADGNQPLQFSLAGGGAIVGVDNGDPTNHEPFKGPTAAKANHKAFHGLALVIIKGGRTAGTLTLSATSAGLTTATTEIRVR